MEIDGKTLGLLFELRDRLAERVAGISAELKALPRYMPNGEEVKTLEDVATVLGTDEFVANLYVKAAVRRVRTREGARQYGQPIGSIIRAGVRQPHFNGYDAVPNAPLDYSRAFTREDDTEPESPDTNGLPVPAKKRVLRKPPVARTKQGRPDPKEKVAADAKFQATFKDLIDSAKKLAKGGYDDSALASRVQKLQDDMDALRAKYKSKGWTLPDVQRKKPTAKKKSGPFVVAAMSQKAVDEYNALPNDEAKRMYRNMRLEGSGHDNAISKALEFAPQFAEDLKLGRKIKGGYKVKPTAEGDEYVLKVDAAGNWHAEYDAGNGTFLEVDPARYKTAAYALAALEKWHKAYYERQNAGQTQPDLPEGSSMTIGQWHPDNGLDYYPVSRRKRDYWLVYDGTGWYSVFYDKNGEEQYVHDNYFADAQGALRFLEQADIEKYRRKPVNTGKPGDRVISQVTISNFDKTSWEDVKKGDVIAVNGDTGEVVEFQSEFVNAPIEYRTIARIRNETIYFTDKTKQPLPYHVYRVKPTKTVSALAQELKDVGTASGPASPSRGFSLPANTRGKRPRRLSGGRKPRALDRCRDILQRQAQKALWDYDEMLESKGVRRVRTREGERIYGQRIGSIIRPDDFARLNEDAPPHAFAARKPKSDALGRARDEDGWTVYDVEIIGTPYSITNDGTGWYSYHPASEKFAEPNYWDTPEEALEALLVWHATQKPKKAPAKKSRVGKKDYPFGTRLQDPPPPATRPVPDKNKVFRKATPEDIARIKTEWGISIPPGYVDVEVNADPDDDSQVARGKSPTSSTPDKWQPLYTAHHIERQHAAKQDKAKKGLGDRPKLEKAVNRDAVTDDNAGMLALVLYMGLRPDSSGGKGPEGLTGKVYGASTLERRHVVVEGKKMFLVFPPAKGKGKVIRLEVKNATVQKALTARLARPDDEQLFSATDGTANAYLKKVMGDYTMRNLRTMVANESALEYMATRKPPFDRPKNKSQLNAIKNEVADHVAGILGNTRTMALNSYIDRNLWDDYSEDIK